MHKILIALMLINNLTPCWLDFGQNKMLVDKTYDEFKEKEDSEKGSKPTDQLNLEVSKNPFKINGSSLNYLTSKAVLAIDTESNEALYSKKEDEKLQIASLTKLMTAYVILKENELSEIVTVPKIISQSGDSLMGIYENEKITTESLLYGLLINSGNDAAQALAIYDSGTLEDFTIKMNRYAEIIGLTNTHYSNPVGWDNKENYSTAKDIANLTRILLRNAEFKKIISNKNFTVYTEDGRAINLTNTNKLLDNISYFGVKTGFTLGAGECFVSLIKQNNNEVLTVVIGSNDRFGETTTLKEWIYSAFLW